MSKYIAETSTILYDDTLWRINASKSGCYTHILKPLLGQIFAMRSHHCQIHAIRFDLRITHYTPNNEKVTKFFKRINAKLKKQYGFTRIGYVWVRETEKAKKQHYHCAFILDGNKAQHPQKILDLIGKIWAEVGGSYHIPLNCYYNVRRNDYEQLQRLIFRVSYLAKGRGKGIRSKSASDYGTSRIKSKPSQPNPIYTLD